MNAGKRIKTVIMSEGTDLNLGENQSLLDFFMLSEGIQFVTMAEKLIKTFRDRRDEHNKKIYDSITDMRDTKKLVEVQSSMLTTRQRMLEDTHSLLDKMVILKKDYRMKKGRAYDNIVNNIQLRMKTTGEKEAIVEGNAEIAEIKHKIEIIEAQAEYYNESMRTIDHILYGIKTRLEVEHLLGA